MKLKASPRNKGKMLIELEAGRSPLLNAFVGPITELKEVLVPIDFSDCSKHALRYALAFAEQFNARITLVSVVHDLHTSFDFANAEYIADMDARKKKYADELGKLAKKELRQLRFKVMVRFGRPYEEIALAARDLDTDLIVISTHGMMGMTGREIGSTAERVIRYAPCPVLVVRQKEREFAPPV